VKTERVDNGQGGLKAEAEIMKKLGSHPNVVTLLGACTEQGNVDDTFRGIDFGTQIRKKIKLIQYEFKI
jgi:serine/threonine protein kinase